MWWRSTSSDWLRDAGDDAIGLAPEVRLERLLHAMATRAPPVQIQAKSASGVHGLIDTALRVLSLGRMTTYLDRYVTTLGRHIHVPAGFEDRPAADRWAVLRHEAVHVEQFARLGWVGITVVYLLLPFPVGLAWGRARLEWEAYAETLRCVALVHGLDAARHGPIRQEIVARFTGPDYLWMWPFRRQVEGWIDAAVDRLEGENARKLG